MKIRFQIRSFKSRKFKLMLISCTIVSLLIGVAVYIKPSLQLDLVVLDSSNIQSVVAKETRVPVLYPSVVSPNVPKVYPSINNTNPDGYDLALNLSSDCQGVSACRIGVMKGLIRDGVKFDQVYKNPSAPNYKPISKSPNISRSVELNGGVPGQFIPYVCGANCTTSKIVWDQGNYRYVVGLAGMTVDPSKELEQLISMANSAISSAK